MSAVSTNHHKPESGLLELVFDTIQDGVFILDHDFNIVLANKWMESRYSSRTPLIGKKCFTVVHDNQDRCPECGYVKALDTGEPQTQIIENSLGQGPGEWLEVCFYPLTNHNGGMKGAVAHFQDITERRQAEELLKDEVTRRRILVEQSRDGIVVLDQNGKVYEANEEYARMLGYTMEEVYELYVWDWDSAFEKEQILTMLETVDERGDHFETRHRRKDGTLLDVEISTNGLVYGGQKLIFCVCRDITEKKALQEQIHELAIRDPLTEIYNRRYIFERLTEIVAERSRTGRNFCVLILDIDHFKRINDTYGHLAGDFVLKEFARVLGVKIRPYDLLGRFGGEEFIIVLTSARASDAEAMTDRLMRTVRGKRFTFEEDEIQFTFSCGIADVSEFAPDAFSIEALIALADKRLYEAKERGRDRCVGPLSSLEDDAGPESA